MDEVIHQKEEIQQYYLTLKKGFNNPENLVEAIELSSFDSLSLKAIESIPELNRFFGGDEDPWYEFLNKGLRSLRPGFYKICEQPFYNKSIFPNTFSAYVYYHHPENDKLIKYQANIGPMTNTHAVYKSSLHTLSIEKVSLRNVFISERNNIGTADDHYLIPKKNFYEKVFNEGKIIFVSESIYDPEFPNVNPRPKKVTWSFIDF